MTALKSVLATALAAIGLMSATAQAGSVPVDLNNCANSQITPNSNDCDGYFDNLNTSGNAADLAFLLDQLDDWGLGLTPEYKDNNTGAGSTTPLFDAVASATGGSFTLNAPLAGAFAVAIKAGNYVGLFLYNETRLFGAGQVFSFTVPDNFPKNNGGTFRPGLSHVSIFGGSSTTVPEPTTLALLGLGLAGIGLSRRRRR